MVVPGDFCGYGRQGPRTVRNRNPGKAAHLWVERRLNQVHGPMCRLSADTESISSVSLARHVLSGAERANSNLSRTRSFVWAGRHRELVGGLRGRAEQRSEEHTSELQSRRDLVCRLLLE